MSNKVSNNPISPKVYVPWLVGLVILVVQLAATGDWGAGEWYNSVFLVLQGVVGYWTKDPLRVTR